MIHILNVYAVNEQHLQRLGLIGDSVGAEKESETQNEQPFDQVLFSNNRKYVKTITKIENYTNKWGNDCWPECNDIRKALIKTYTYYIQLPVAAIAMFSLHMQYSAHFVSACPFKCNSRPVTVETVTSFSHHL